MNKARLFENKDVLISAADVENGTISKFQEFITPEEEFKVTYVSKAKNNGKPYFRLYYSYEDKSKEVWYYYGYVDINEETIKVIY